LIDQLPIGDTETRINIDVRLERSVGTIGSAT